MNAVKQLTVYGIIFLASRTAGLETCQPAEEGQPYQMRYTLTTIPAHRTMLLWYNDGQLVSECPVEAGECSNNDINWLHARVEKRNTGVEFILDIQNVTRDNDKNAQGVWTLKTHSMEPTSQEIYSCALQVYAKAVDIFCVTDVVTKGVTISCSTSRIYPEAMMSVYRNGHQLQSSSCANNKIPDNPMYFEAACKIIIPVEKLYLKRNSFDINIFPNVIGFSELKFLRTVKMLTFHIAPGPFTQQNCTEAGTDVTCRCTRMDSKTFKSNFDWYLNNKIVKQKSDVYTFAKEQDVANSISCLVHPVDSPDGKTPGDKSALVAVTTLLVIAVILIVVLCLIYIKKCKPVRDVLPDIRYHFHKKADNRKTSATDIQARDKDDTETSLLNEESKAETEEKKPSSLQEENGAEASQTMEIKKDDVRPDPIGISSNSMSDKEPTKNEGVDTSVSNNVVVADKNIFKTTSSILLLGTQRSNKKLLRKSIINGDYTIEITQNVKTVVDSKSGKELVKVKPSRIGNFPKISLPDEEKISLHYTKRGDQVIKLVDGPVFDAINVHKFINDIKKCIVLSQEGYNAIIVTFTANGVKECNLLLNIFHKNFSVKMNYVFPILIYEKEFKFSWEMKDEYSALEKVCDERLIKYNIENHTKEVNMLLSSISQMEEPCTRHLLCVNKENFQRYSKLEEILKDIKLLFDVCLDESIPMQDEIKVILHHVKMLWSEYQGNNDKTHPINDSFVIEANQEESGGLVTTNIQFGTKQKLEIDSNIIEDITHIMECLRYIYFGEEPMKRCKVILIKSVQESYKHFHDWYVSSVTKDRDNLLETEAVKNK